jgi:PAS domain S-box-containing protein
MSFILISSIIIRLAAFSWSILLLRQLKDWRMAFLSGMLALMAIRQILTMISERESWAIVFHWHVEELPGLVVSILAFLAIFYLKSMITEHDQAVAEHHKSESRMATILGIAADAIITVDKDQHILQFNQGAEQIFGYSTEEVLGQPLDLLLPSRFVKVHQQHIRTFATSPKSTRRMGELSQDIFGRRKDGNEFPADASISRLSVDNKISFTVILRDITDRVQLEEAVNKSEKHLRNVLDGLGPHMLVGLMTPEGTLIEANRPALEIAGLKPEDVLGKPFEETYWWSYSESVKQQLRDTIHRAVKGETCRYDVVVRAGEKHFITIDFCLQPLLDEAGNVFYLIPSAIDITERKRAEDHIQHLRGVLESIRNVNQLIVHEKNQQKLLQGACDIIIQTRHYSLVWIGILQKDSKDVLPAAQSGFEDDYLKSVKVTLDDSETGKGPTGTAIKTGMPSLMRDIASDSRYKPWREQALKYGYASSASVPLIHENRVYGALNVYSTIDAFDEEEVKLLVEVSQDIGFALHGIELEEKRNRAEEALHKAHEELESKVMERTNKLAQANIRLQELDQLKSMFIASMSHELRTPLNPIIGFSGIMLQGMSGEVTEEQRKQLTIVKRNANHLLGLINDIIDVSKIKADKVELAIERFDLPSLVREVKESFTLAAQEHDLALALATPDSLTIESDKRRVKQILVNFVSNAVKFTDQGKIEMKVVKRGDVVKISVMDTGIGIREEDMGHLLKAFSRIRTEGRIREGSGLGLYLSRKIAILLGGGISAESEFGKGSTFTFILSLRRMST